MSESTTSVPLAVIRASGTDGELIAIGDSLALAAGTLERMRRLGAHLKGQIAMSGRCTTAAQRDQLRTRADDLWYAIGLLLAEASGIVETAIPHVADARRSMRTDQMLADQVRAESARRIAAAADDEPGAAAFAEVA